jgi:hypothetical protein
LSYPTLPYVGLSPAGTPGGLTADRTPCAELPPAPATALINDPEMAATFESVCAFWVNANAAGADPDTRGNVTRRDVPVACAASVPCHPVIGEAGVVTVGDVDYPVVFARFLFPVPVALDVRHSIRWQDPDRAAPRKFLVKDASYCPGQLREYWAVDCYERVRVQPF